MEATPQRTLDTSNPENIRYQQGALDITILGGIRLEGLDSHDVNYQVEAI